MELQEGAPFLGNEILLSYILGSYDQKCQKSPINICFVICILVFAPYVHIELPLGSSRSELHFLGYVIWAPYTFRSYDKKFQKSAINICFVDCDSVVAPYVYIVFPLGSSVFGQWDLGSLHIQEL